MNKTMALGAALTLSSALAHADPLTLDVYNTDAGSFHVTATVISGATEAVVVDTGFTKADALQIAAKVLNSGKQLKTIFISQADPDYYFGAEVLQQLFPKAEIVTTTAVRDVIAKKMDAKVSFWGPKMGANAPIKPVLPAVYAVNSLTVDGERIEVKGDKGPFAHRPYLWIPANKTILGNVAVFSDVHLWTADSQSDASLNDWEAQLNEMLALNPTRVVPGHMVAGAAQDASAIRFTQHYLQTFRTEKARSKNSGELINALQNAYPNAGLPMALEISAKVHMKEMAW